MAGSSKDEDHGTTPFPQRRVQASGRSGVPVRRDAARLGQRHDLSRNLVRVWVQKYETGAFDDDAAAADTIQAYEARIAALERLVGRQALELEFLKGALRWTPPRSGPTSVITGPAASPSQRDAG